jgi:hypothetical protein
MDSDSVLQVSSREKAMRQDGRFPRQLCTPSFYHISHAHGDGTGSPGRDPFSMGPWPVDDDHEMRAALSRLPGCES